MRSAIRLEKNMLEQITEPKEKKRTDYSGVIIGAILLPLLLTFIHFGKEDIGRSVFICLGAVMLAIRIRWDLRKHFWFWAIIVLVLLLNLPLILLVRWPSGWVPAIEQLPLAVAECLITVGAVRLGEMLMGKTQPPNELL
jgi:lysylphosphatidylglycerol synthetase-like protein (DUF2156 family)